MKPNNTVAIIGQGYVGLPLAMASVNADWNVIGIDSSDNRVLNLSQGKSHIDSISGNELTSALSSNKYQVTSDFEKVALANIVIICVCIQSVEPRWNQLSLKVCRIRYE